ncbi:MAG: FtsH protease activity modulator HflK [Nitratireductor sp.]|nr:FtsH protease activity modulator HflK [Nitratireductor sp.]
MPWNNQNGGGPWGSGGDNDGGAPWGKGSGGPKKGGGQPPDLEDIIRQGQERLKNVIPGGGGFSPGIIALILLAAVALYGFKSIYTIQPDELGIELRFGKAKQDVSEPGLHFLWWPVETYEVANIRENQINIGTVGRGSNSSGLMLSGDQNIVDLAFSVLYQVTDPSAYLFNTQQPDELVRQVAESAMREVVGRRPAQDIFRDDRAGVANEVRQIVQDTLTEYKTGLTVNAVNIEDVAPPGPVADAFDEVQRAEQDEDRFIEEGNRYSNRILGEARGEAAQIREDAAAYKNRVVEEAKGEAQRFISVYDEYSKAPEVTRKRLFLETMEKVLSGSEKVIIEQGQGGTGVVPYLPLPEIQKHNQSQTGASQ